MAMAQIVRGFFFLTRKIRYRFDDAERQQKRVRMNFSVIFVKQIEVPHSFPSGTVVPVDKIGFSRGCSRE
jgi:hypothetical protein